MIRSYNQEEFIEKIMKEERTEEILYGEIHTPFHFVETILSILPETMFSNPELKWLDPACGSGNFMIVLYYKLLKGLEQSILEIEERKDHIIKNMLFMVEIQEKNVALLALFFGKTANIRCEDFLTMLPFVPFDCIVGNPPFNFGNKVKVPSSTNNKTADGTTIWPEFVRKSLSLLKEETGKLCFFIPSLWLKPDKKNMYSLMLNYKVEWLTCYSNTETNKIFKGKTQTPCCFFLLTKEQTNHSITIYDRDVKRYLSYTIHVGENKPVPVFGQEVCKKIQQKNYSKLNVIKTRSPTCPIQKERNDEFKYENVRSCVLIGEKKVTPKLIIEYSNEKLRYTNTPKLILAHKMYGFPYLDSSGIYGIMARDNYILTSTDYSLNELQEIQAFLSTKIALFIFSTTNYRMRYLERYAFQYIPAITKLQEFPSLLNLDPNSREKLIVKFFNFSLNEETIINNSFANYNYFI